MFIEGNDGAKIHRVSVDDEGRLFTFAVSENEDRHINQKNGKVWSAVINGVAIDAGQYIAYFKNTGTANYHLTDIRAHMQFAASMYTVEFVSGTVGGGTSLLPAEITSRNLGSSTDPIGTMEYATAATGLTGLTSEGVLFYAGSLDNKSSHLRTSSNIIIPPGTAIAIKVITANAAPGVTMTGSFVEVPVN